MHLKPAKCSFSMHPRKFLGFILTRRGVGVNPEKYRAIINMRSPFNIKEVQKITCKLFALALFLSCVGDKEFHFFSIVKNKKFIRTSEFEKAFSNLKAFLET